MVTILLEGALFAALVAAVVAFLAYGLLGTPPGTRLLQTLNRRRIERRAARLAERTCATHGAVRERDLVRLPDGTRICPQCYAELF